MEEELNGKKKIRPDPIEALQNHFVELSKSYVTALRQCSQGGLAAVDELDVDAPQIMKVVTDALTLIDDLPDANADKESLEELVKEDEELNKQLQISKTKAEQTLQKIKKLRTGLAEVVLGE